MAKAIEHNSEGIQLALENNKNTAIIAESAYRRIKELEKKIESLETLQDMHELALQNYDKLISTDEIGNYENRIQELEKKIKQHQDNKEK